MSSESGDLLPHAREDCLRIGVFLAAGQLPKNLGSLMCCLDTLPTAGLQELRNAFLDLSSCRHPKNSCRNDYYLGIIRHLGVACKHEASNAAGGRGMDIGGS